MLISEYIFTILIKKWKVISNRFYKDIAKYMLTDLITHIQYGY